ncbi:EF-Hand 1, calcium-binding site [Sesbania bispinosa]|nr:EF-Hand 1, calcium-binding site [Sesbania bispinosa]
MKLININPKHLKLSPKRLFRSKKERSEISRSDPPSFGSGASSSPSSSEGSTHKAVTGGSRTPTSVLPDVSGDWSDVEVRWEFAQAFRLIDRDNDGVVSREELEAVLTRLGARPLSPEEVEMMLREVDGEGRGCISVEALINRVGSESGSGDELKEVFEVFDTDLDGRISAEELLRVFRAIGDERCTLEECRRMIEGVDKNGDGFVCFEDFARESEIH